MYVKLKTTKRTISTIKKIKNGRVVSYENNTKAKYHKIYERI